LLVAAACGDAGADVQEGAASARAPIATTAPAAVPAKAAPREEEPKRPTIAEVLAAIPEDPPPKKIIQETHYFVSNELTPESFRGQVKRRGGIYLGVGAEQNYLYAGWARAEVLIVADFDQWVVDVHFVHGLLMRHAPDPAAFVELWSAKQKERARELITAAVADPVARERILDLHRIAHRGVYAKLLHQRYGYRDRGIRTWLTSRKQYEHVAGLYERGHARALRGDFTGNLSLAGIAAAARQLELPVRTIYLSNVEDYFAYDGGLGRNLLAQPIDEQSILLRTWAVDKTNYMYVAQRTADFHRWLQRPGIHHRGDILSRTKVQERADGMFLGGP
jgi:hypothetical protein